MYSEIYQDISKIESLNLGISSLSKFISYDFIRCIHLIKNHSSNNHNKNQLILSLQFQDLITQKLEHLYRFNSSLTFEMLELFKPGLSIQNENIDIFPEIFEFNKELLSLCYNEYQNASDEIKVRFGEIVSDTPWSSILDSMIIHRESFNKTYMDSIDLSDELIKSTNKYLKAFENSYELKKKRLLKFSTCFTMESERQLLHKIIQLDYEVNNTNSNSIELF